MKIRPTVLTSVGLAVASSIAFALHAPQASKPAHRLSELALLAGAWIADESPVQIEEHWIEPKAGAMFGCGRTIRDDKTLAFEFLRIERRQDGEIYYVAQPGGRCPATDFKLTSVSGGEFLFENPEHDFPQRIRYELNDDGSMTASIEGELGGESTAQRVHFRRAKN